MRGKHVALLATCGGEAEGNADLIQLIFEREMDYLGCRILGKYIVEDCTTPAELGATATDAAQRMAEDFSRLAGGLEP